jgi:hypothetical protein
MGTLATHVDVQYQRALGIECMHLLWTNLVSSPAAQAATAQKTLQRAAYSSHVGNMGRHENVAPGPSWTVVIVG